MVLVRSSKDWYDSTNVKDFIWNGKEPRPGNELDTRLRSDLFEDEYKTPSIFWSKGGFEEIEGLNLW